MQRERPFFQRDPLSMLPREQIEGMPVFVALKKQFSAMLPHQFGAPTVHLSPIPSLLSVLRSDCTIEGCGTRAIIHIARDQQSNFGFVEKGPSFDRAHNARCPHCVQMFFGGES